MRYRLTFGFILLLSWLISVSCQQKGNGQKTSNQTPLPSADTVYTLGLSHSSFRQLISEKDNPKQKKFVRLTATEIHNPAQVSITFELYYVSGNKKILLGSVAPFPANNPGSFIIATGGRIEKEGELELQLKFPEDWDKQYRITVKMKPLTFE